MPTLKRSLLITLLIVNLSLISFFSAAQKLIPPPIIQADWARDYEPFRICGNLYYVGTYDLASYLITTPQGHILVNTGLAESVPMIRSHVEALGFRFSDIKILLATHAHFDHVGGMAEIKKITGAKMMINENDAPAKNVSPVMAIIPKYSPTSRDMMQCSVIYKKNTWKNSIKSDSSQQDFGTKLTRPVKQVWLL